MSQHSSNMSQDSPNSSQHRSKRPLRDARNLDFHQISTFSCPSWRFLRLLQMHDFFSLQSIAPSLVDTFSIVSLQPILKLSATSALINAWVCNCFDAYGLANLGAGGKGAALQSGVARQVLLCRVRSACQILKSNPGGDFPNFSFPGATPPPPAEVMSCKVCLTREL